MSLAQVLAQHIGDDPGGTHAAEAAQWAIEVDGRREAGVAGKSGDTPLDDATYFDIASVSKLFTATAAMIAVDQNRVSFDSKLGDQFPEAVNSNATLAQLLNHSSGFPAWEKYYEVYPFPMTEDAAHQNREQIRRDILATPARIAPSLVAEYSDLGFMMLGWWVERLFDAQLDQVVQTHIISPLDLQRTRYVADAPPIEAVRTELDQRRSHVTDSDGAVCGVVHDENCYIQGGVAGHAGLFSTASDLVEFGSHMRDISEGNSGILSTEILRYAWERVHTANGGHHVLGWDTPSGKRTSVGRGFGFDSTVGHLGFTGTSLWIDRTTRTVAALLSNRVFPSRENPLILDLRIAFHEAVQTP